jgi:hypothetical protein
MNTDTIGNLQYEVAPPLIGVASAATCVTFDAQFNYGLVALVHSIAAINPSVHVYWRPSRGGRN